MSESFDPYRKWLGIPPEEQPPNHYRLLGIGLFEADADVIQEAADRQMSHVQTHKIGRHAEYSQKLLNELTAAKICLLQPQRREAYDTALRRQLAPQQPPPAAAPARPPVKPPAILPAKAQVSAAMAALELTPEERMSSRRAARPAERRFHPLLIPGAAVAAGLLAIVIWALVAGRGGKPVDQEAIAQADQRQHAPPAADIAPNPDEVDVPNPQDPAPDAAANPAPADPAPASDASPAAAPDNTTVDAAPPDDPEDSFAPDKRPSADPPTPDAAPADPAPSNGVGAAGNVGASGQNDLDAVVRKYFSPPEAKPGLLPPPADPQPAIDLVREVFADEYKSARKPAEKLALANKLLQQAQRSESPEERFALYSEAETKGREAASASLVVQAASAMATRFAIDQYERLGTALEPLTRDSQPTSAKKDLAEELIKLADRAVADSRYDAATRLMLLALTAGNKAADAALVKRIKARGTEINDQKKRFDAAGEQAQALAKDPTDTAAARAVGVFVSFDKADWQLGLPLLVRGDDEKLRELAEQELAAGFSSDDQVKLADAWWAAGGADAKLNRLYQTRAEFWYRKAEPGLRGLTQTRVRKRLKEFDDAHPAMASARPPVVNTNVAANANDASPLIKPEKGSGKADKAATNASVVQANRVILARVKAARKKGPLPHSQVIGGTFGNAFEEVPGSLLVGFNYTTNNNQYLSSIQPVYHGVRNASPGGNYGVTTGSPTQQQVMAKPGYAVGAIRVQGTGLIYGFEVEFMKVDSKGNLDPSDSYTSDWIGQKYSQSVSVIDAEGQPVVGVFGRTSPNQVRALGLVHLPTDTK